MKLFKNLTEINEIVKKEVRNHSEAPVNLDFKPNVILENGEEKEVIEFDGSFEKRLMKERKYSNVMISDSYSVSGYLTEGKIFISIETVVDNGETKYSKTFNITNSRRG